MSSPSFPACTRLLPLVMLMGVSLPLAGCGTGTQAIRTVRVPVRSPCIGALPARPLFATQTLMPDASDGEKVLAIARDLPLHLKYEGVLEAALAACL
ncbi:hypothetical protein [Massilia antarctica]|uniref:hypothetical protein n=1 Tax=Massilia antarctica TaxID=2765360 RepID=UPI0006BB5A1B|nr:hypothetical protein [Massilia sp. H27-R4]MCY0911137.1 hypothetical protein [Massilia sp. H27-R4]CUI05279.1 hypothetical protein BN2497_5335 [Janthinobacterium sp. CG23_2]CUU29065.1 hypothetical protein BN3177_5335 [Janthinobacterium sp. CG23_2]